MGLDFKYWIGQVGSTKNQALIWSDKNFLNRSKKSAKIGQKLVKIRNWCLFDYLIVLIFKTMVTWVYQFFGTKDFLSFVKKKISLQNNLKNRVVFM